jgi:hypothetical protein
VACQFSKLWSTTAKNIVLQIDSWVNHAGEVDTTDAQGWLQTSGHACCAKAAHVLR